MRASSKIQPPRKPSGFTGTRRAGPGTRRSLSTPGCRYPVSHHCSRHACTYVGTRQSSSGGSCIALAGNRSSLVGEPLLSRREKGWRGAFGPCLYVISAQKFLSDFKSIGSIRSSNRFVELLVVRTGHWKLQDPRAFFSNALSIWKHGF